jgi:glycosyltransferase involved in cell wall biosynthesis
MRKPVILIITDNLPGQINGVVTTYNNIERLAIQDGYRVEYVCPTLFKNFAMPLYPEVRLSLAFDIGTWIESVNPQHIHIATEGPVGLAARQYLNRQGYSYTSAYHTKFPEAIRKLVGVPEAITWPAVRWFHKDSSCVLTTTKSMVEQLRSHHFTNTVVPWTRGIDRSIFFPDPERKPNSIKTLICVSRISREKNLEAFLGMNYPNSRKVMVGDGPMLETYRKAYPDVEFTGYLTGKPLADRYRAADVFVFPSRWDTFGLVMIEAMACGTPVAAFPVQGPLDVIDPGVDGVMDNVLMFAVEECLTLDRAAVYCNSQRWTWDAAWQIFQDRLVKV